MSFSVVIRADANSLVGMGHIMRCLSIADSFVSVYNDVRIMFVLADDSVAQLVNDKGYETFVLGSDYSVMDDEYDKFFGFTPSEVRKMLEYYGVADKEDELKDWYDGYLFGSTEIYNPWSVINYISRGCIPQAYWVNTGNN